MSTAFRIVRGHFDGDAHADWDDYSSVDPDEEGSVITAPGTTVSEAFWVWTSYRTLAFRTGFSCGIYSVADVPYGYKRLLVVTYDEADIIDTRDLGLSGTSGTHITGGDIGDELSFRECSALASFADAYGGRLAWDDILTAHGA